MLKFSTNLRGHCHQDACYIFNMQNFMRIAIVQLIFLKSRYVPVNNLSSVRPPPHVSCLLPLMYRASSPSSIVEPPLTYRASPPSRIVEPPLMYRGAAPHVSWSRPLHIMPPPP